MIQRVTVPTDASIMAYPPQTFAYHEISNDCSNDVYSITPEVFLQHLWVIRDAARAASRSFTVTFDDGHGSNLHWAAPLLETLDMRGHFFLPSTWISSRNGHMSWNDVRMLAAGGHVIGSHGATHRFLTQCPREKLHQELYCSRMSLEDHIGMPVTTISMPGGRWNEEVIQVCSEAGYEALYTSEPGYYRPRKHLDGNITSAVIGRFAVCRRTSPHTLAAYAGAKWMTVNSLRNGYHLRRRIKRVLGDTGYQKLWSYFFRTMQG